MRMLRRIPRTEACTFEVLPWAIDFGFAEAPMIEVGSLLTDGFGVGSVRHAGPTEAAGTHRDCPWGGTVGLA